MKGRAITLPKREPNPLCEDASRLIPGRLLAVADGAGGGGLYADLWAQYLIEHLPTEAGFANAEALDGWLSGIWEEFYNACERQAQQSGSFYLNKFYDEGSFSTLAALWRVSPRSYYWVAYGDSVAFHYSRRRGTLSHSFGALRDFHSLPTSSTARMSFAPRASARATLQSSLVIAYSSRVMRWLNTS